MIQGIGPDAATMVNATGGKQSEVMAELSTLPMLALIQVGKVTSATASPTPSRPARRRASP